VLGLLLIGTTAYAFWAIVDQGITIAYRDGSVGELQRSQAFLEQVVLRITPTTTRSQLLAIVRESDSLAFEKGGAIYAGGFGFYFDQAGKVSCVTAGYPAEETHCKAFARPDQ